MTDVSTRLTVSGPGSKPLMSFDLSNTVLQIGGAGVSTGSGGNGLPKGGASGQVLVKKSSADGDADWGAQTVNWNSTNW